MQQTTYKSLLVDEVLEKAKIKVTVEYKGRLSGITKWKIVLRKRDNSDKFFFEYTTKEDQPPTYAELFTHLIKHDPGNFINWCEILGYNPDSRTDKREYDQQLREFKNLERLFTPEQLELLRTLDID